MADSDSSTNASASPGAGEKHDWPVRGHFSKKYQPYGVRVCDETLSEIRKYDDCYIIRGVRVAEPHSFEVKIYTREGRLKAQPGDWIMEDSEGHHYPIAHDELRKTYQPVDSSRPKST